MTSALYQPNPFAARSGPPLIVGAVRHKGAALIDVVDYRAMLVLIAAVLTGCALSATGSAAPAPARLVTDATEN